MDGGMDSSSKSRMLSKTDIADALRMSSDPLDAIDKIQKEHAPSLPECEPVIGFLENLLGIKRFDLYRELCDNLKETVSGLLFFELVVFNLISDGFIALWIYTRSKQTDLDRIIASVIAIY